MGGTETQIRSHAGRETRYYFCHRGIRFGSSDQVLPRHPSATTGADGEEASALQPVSTLKVLFRNRVLRSFVLPINRQDPPPAPVVEKLNAIDPAHEWLGIVRIVTRFVCAPNMRDLTELFDSPRDFLFVESSRPEISFHPGNVGIDIQNLRRKIDVVPSGIDCGWDQSCAGDKKRSLAVPIALLSGRSGDHVVGCGDNRFDRFDISRIRRSFRYLRHLPLLLRLASLPSYRFGTFQMLV